MKRHYYFKEGFLGIIGILIFSAVTAYGAEESITLTTYYPSPYGVYSEMRLYPKPSSATPCASGNPASQRGVMYYDSDDNQLKVCGGSSPDWQLLGGGYWAASPFNSNNIYNTNFGNVGIGTTNPQHAIDAFSTTNSEFGIVTRTSNNNYLAGIGINPSTLQAGVGLQTPGKGWVIVNENGNFYINEQVTVVPPSGAQYRFAIAPGGNVGIGTTDPSERLHVNGNLYVGSNWIKAGNLIAVNNAISAWGAEGGVIAGFRNGNAVAIGQSGAGAYPGLGITSGSSPLASFYSGNGEVGIASYAGGPNAIRMYKEFPRGWSAADVMLVRDGTIHLRNRNGIDRLFVASSGFVGIGTANPAVKLHVVGDMGCQFPGSGVYGDYFYVNQESGRPVARIFDDGSYNPVLQFGKGNSWMNLEYTGSTLNIGGNTGSNVSAYDYWIGALSKWASSFSDIRLKENIQPITDVLERIQAIKCVSFNWNEAYAALGHPNDKRQIGVIAQDVEQSFPELVISSEERGYKSVNYDGVTAVLLEAIKEQQAEIESLEARIETLEKR